MTLHMTCTPLEKTRNQVDSDVVMMMMIIIIIIIIIIIVKIIIENVKGILCRML